jgi:cytochrome c peroxidase
MAKTRTKKLLGLMCLVVILLVLALPISNLLASPSRNSLSRLQTDDPHLNQAAAIMADKCADCHSRETDLPFYANFPLASGLIQRDIREGMDSIDLVSALGDRGDRPVSEVVLAKIERTIEKNAMPPRKYVLLHWDAALDRQDREVISTWITRTRADHYVTPDVAPAFAYEVIQPLPRTVDLDPAKVALGRELYHDTRLSGDGTLACASCHDLNRGGTDRSRFSEGVGEAMGAINAPTTYNCGYQFLQFWDGRAPTLEEQAKGPVENPIEMGDSWDDVVAELQADEDFVRRFTAVYPGGVSVDNIVSAIADFERSLITPDSRFDRYLRGETTALSEEEQEGYRLFKQCDCATCHAGKILGGQSFETMGRKKAYFADRGNVGEADYGRFNATGREEDKHRFKVPTLRNIACTYPYFHDGSTNDLEEAVRTMAHYQCGMDLEAEQVRKIALFLDTLTGEYEGRPLD